MEQQKNFFTLFGLPQQFDVNLSELTERYRALQKQFHPDKFANASASERTLSVQQASLVNDAYTVLKSPLLRVKYLLEINGVSLDEESNSIMDPDFLMQQMEMRETLESVATTSDPLGALDEIADKVDKQNNQIKKDIRSLFLEENICYEKIVEDVRKWQFFSRLQTQIDELYIRYEKN